MIKELIKLKDSRKPKWFLRQIVTYSRIFFIRNKHNNFIDFCLDEDSIVGATMLPLKYYNITAILFSDILLLPHFLGQKVTFKKEIGPVLKN